MALKVMELALAIKEITEGQLTLSVRGIPDVATGTTRRQQVLKRGRPNPTENRIVWHRNLLSACETESWFAALATWAFALVNITSVCSIAVAAVLTLQLVDVLAVIRSNFSCVLDNFLSVAIHEARNRCSPVTRHAEPPPSVAFQEQKISAQLFFLYGCVREGCSRVHPVGLGTSGCLQRHV